jgi:2-polyprenyl-3-methyl-5-hydroxy-6-metoxy-1,4-benzoquinol methylase
VVALVRKLPETADIETSSEDYARRFSGSVGHWFLKVQEEATLRMLAPHSGATVLDVGGGHGQIADALVRNGYRLTVFGSADVCRMRIQHLLEENRCSFDSGNILQLPYTNSSFDIVVSYRLLPHVSRWPQFLSELARVARLGVLIDYPAIRSINFIAPQLFRIKKRFEGNTRTFNSFSESQLLDHFESNGFKRVDRYAQFFLPMVLHRMLKSGTISSGLERAFRLTGATPLFGSPVILKLLRKTVRA